jgi:lysophospholipase L1-like esterase
MRYVALGDSYTIGTSVAAVERWPNQLVARLAAVAATSGTPSPLELVGNPAVNGFTTRDVIAVELPELERLRPDLVSLLIGTNDVIQGIAEEPYRRNLAAILDAVQAQVPPSRVFGVTTPDYTVTPAGGDYGDPAIQSARLRRYNAIFEGVLSAHGIAIVDIHDISLEAARDRSLIAGDGLHPSGAQYARWVDRIAPVVTRLVVERDAG